MIPRYSRPEMVAMWSPETKFRIWFEIEAHACDALAAIGTDRLLFETDYPHSDSTWPHCQEMAEKQMAHLDAETAADVGAAIERLAAGRTTLLIVHRAVLAARADRTLVLRGGQLTEQEVAA